MAAVVQRIRYTPRMIPELAYLLFFAGLAGIVQGTVGFGFGLVAMSTLPLWMDIKEAVPVVACFAWS